MAKGQQEVDKYDIEYNGSDKDVHNQLQGFGGTLFRKQNTIPKGRETVLNEGVNDLYDRLEPVAPKHFLDPINKKGSVV